MSSLTDAPGRDERVVCVLRAIDEGQRAATIAAWAGALADGLGVPLDLVGVAEALAPVGITPVPGVPLASVPEVAALQEPPVDLTAVAERAGVRPASRRELPGPVAGVLEELAAEPLTALIVVGDDGDGALWSAISGAPIRRALRELPAPLVLVPHGVRRPQATRWRVAAGIMNPEQCRPVLSIASALAQRLDGELILLADGASQATATEQASDLLPSDARPRTELLPEDPAAVLGDVLAHGDADLLVLAPPERGLLASAILGSVFHAVAAGGHGPIVVAPGAAPPS
ncbi:MAG: universal stress protein [Solirubrobacterales bacterium]|nr:universal stress protein [Solirubrobacterales bacterium]